MDENVSTTFSTSVSLSVVQDLEKQEAKVRNTKDLQNVGGLVDLFEEDNFVMCEFWGSECSRVFSVIVFLSPGICTNAVVGEERFRLQPHALEDPLVQELTEVS